METVKRFDEELRKQYSYEFMIGKFVWILLLSLGLFAILIPLEEGFTLLSNASSMLLGLSMFFYIKPYMMVTEEGKQISIYKKLKWMPVSKKDIAAVRREYLNRFCLKVGIASACLQITGAFLNHSLDVNSFLFPVFVNLCIWLFGLWMIYLKN